MQMDGDVMAADSVVNGSAVGLKACVGLAGHAWLVTQNRACHCSPFTGQLKQFRSHPLLQPFLVLCYGCCLV